MYVREETTWFHLPDAKTYQPGTVSDEIYKAGWYIYLPVGTTVTLHGLPGQQFRVVRSHFHVGQPGELHVLHIFLESEEPS